MAATNGIELEGIIAEALPNAMFRVTVSVPAGDQGVKEATLLATISGKMRMHYIRILPGDKVKVMVVPPDLSKGRIIYRYRS